MNNEQTLDDIWERASLELDYQKITAKKGTRGPQKMDKKTLWSRKIMEHLYLTLMSTNTINWSIDHAYTIEQAFQDIGWNHKASQSRHKFTVKDMTDRFHMLYRTNQNHIWHLACELMQEQQEGGTTSDLPPQMLRHTWETLLEDKIHEHEVKARYKVNKDTYDSNLDIAVKAFEAIGWKVPRSALTMFYAGEARDLLEEYMKRLIWYTGCSHQRKPREFYTASSIGMK